MFKKQESDDADSSNKEKLLVDIWKQAVDTQKHFNDMCVKSRQLGLTFVAASLGAALYLFIRSPTGGTEQSASPPPVYAYAIDVAGHSVILHVSLAIIFAAYAAVRAVRQLDLGVYHQMLRGAVTFGEDLEERHIRPLVGLQMGMTQSISHFSRHSDAAVEKQSDRSYKYLGNNKQSAADKLTGFYELIQRFLLFSAIAIFIASNFLKVA
ncbi:hypothetical protein DNX69_01695 [Rhodopseudomonas palustris]|uniref:Uncharacterized protein n=2 Tax=Rhodopseudomonas palustris TaxID=1076 RepID=A0A323URK9_RHOPL|nr:hypothetical protein DNX69_01695 [Rhodopseudomonas palustris]